MSAVRRTTGLKITPPVYWQLRLTVPVREALEQSGNRVTPQDSPGLPMYSVELTRPPSGIVECVIGHGSAQHRGLRLDIEPPYPGEWPSDVLAWHWRGQWLPCPQCGSALVWYEAGYVPGYRVCLEGHHVQLSGDGRSASLVRM